MKKQSIIKNYLYNLSYQILTMFLPLIITPYISRVLGAKNIGIYSYTLSVTTFFILFGSLGVALYGQREIAYHQNNKMKYSYIFWEVFILRCISMVISLGIYYFTFGIGNNEYNIYYQILMLEIIGNIIDISWFFQGLEEFKKIILRNTLIKLISLLLIFIFVKRAEDLVIYFFIYVGSTFFGNLSLWLYIPQKIEKISLNKIRVGRHLKSTIALFIPQIAAIINNKEEVGFYEQTQKIVKMLLTIISSLGIVMMPRIANTFAMGEKEKVQKYMKKSFNMVFFLGFPLVFGTIVISDAFVPFFFGEGYDKVKLIMKVMSPIILFIGLSGVNGTQYLLPTEQ